ncbi:unnamed protein product, partial [Scytosiphon promiscuus]
DVSTVAGDAAETPAAQEQPEEEYETHVMIGGVMQMRCKMCKTRLGRAGCSTGSCVECCFKAARSCAAHAKQHERRRLEAELLAAGPSQSQIREKQRNIKGIFKEDSFHAIGDTATVWCFLDFLCAKSNQAAFTALSRTQRAAIGREARRSSSSSAKTGSAVRGIDAKRSSSTTTNNNNNNRQGG